jgi:hypothetical protein
MLAYVLANSMVEKFGGDRLDEIQSSLERYRKEIKP